MIRILHMIGSLNIGGSQAMIMNLYRNIDREQIQFDFVIDHPSHLYYADEVKRLGGHIYVMEPFKGKNIKRVIKAWEIFWNEHPEYRILHSHVRSYASLYIPIAKKHGVKTIIHSHSTSNGKGVTSIIKSILQIPLRYQADFFLGCSKKSGEWLFGEKIVKSDRYFVLQNAIDLDLYKIDEREKEDYCRALAILGKPIYIHVGRFHESKNHMFLIEVFNDIKKKEQDAVLLLVGDGELKDEIKKRIDELNLSEAVLLLGNRDDVPKLLSISDCFLFPSKWEGLPVSVVEAQAAGLPCLVSETITREVAVSELVKYLPIDKGVLIWSEEAEKNNRSKKEVIQNIIDAGFDIKRSSAWLENFYERIIDK